MLNNNDEPQNKRKKTPLTKKVKRIFTAPKGVDAHARYPEEYYKQFWFNHQDSDEIAIIAQVEGLTQKAVAHWMADVFYQFYIQHYVSEEVKLQQSTGELQKRVRRNLALKRIARKRGWSIDKLLKLESSYKQKPT
jgi:hypothetical protein